MLFSYSFICHGLNVLVLLASFQVHKVYLPLHLFYCWGFPRRLLFDILKISSISVWTFFSISISLFNSIFISWTDFLISLSSSLCFLGIHLVHLCPVSFFLHIFAIIFNSLAGISSVSLSLEAIAVGWVISGGIMLPWVFFFLCVCFCTEACVFDVMLLFRVFQCHLILLVQINCNDEEEIDCSRMEMSFSSTHLVLRASGSIPNTSPKVEYCLQKQSLSYTMKIN